MARLSDVKLGKGKVTGNHYNCRIDMTEKQEEENSAIRKIKDILEAAVEAGEITGFYFGWNFDENVTGEYE